MSTPTYAMPRAEARPTSLGAAFAVLVLAMLPAVLDQTVLATALPTIAGRRIARTGRLRRLPVLGAAVMAAALAGLALAAPAASPALVDAGLVVFGAGFGLTSQLLVVAALAAIVMVALPAAVDRNTEAS